EQAAIQLIFHSWLVGPIWRCIHAHGDIELVAPIEDRGGKDQFHDLLVTEMLADFGEKGVVYFVGVPGNALNQPDSNGLTWRQPGLVNVTDDAYFLGFHLTANCGGTHDASIGAPVDLAGLDAHHLQQIGFNDAFAEEFDKDGHNRLQEPGPAG